MKVIGGHDYYDTAMGFGHDPSTVFVRGDNTINEDIAARHHGLLPADLPYRLASVKRERRAVRYRLHDEAQVKGRCYNKSAVTVIVAGTRYQGVRLETRQHGRGTMRDYFWQLNHLTRHLQDNGLKLEADAWAARNAFNPWKRARTIPADTLEQFFTPAPLPNTLRDHIIEQRWTLLVHDDAIDHHIATPWLIDHPVLKHLHFYRVIPANIMFQEIEMWIGGILPRVGNPMAIVSDEVRAAKHGMDATSFRKPKAGA